MKKHCKKQYDSYVNHYSSTTALDTIDDMTEKEIRIFDDNKWAYDYISKLRVGNFINFRETEGKKKIIRSGRVYKIYGDKFCMTVLAKNRKFVKVVTINDIVTKTFFDERWEN
jgi:uncharacterized protein Veg